MSSSISTTKSLTEPIQWVGIFSSVIVFIIFVAITVISNTNVCADNDTSNQQISKRECCKGTWEYFHSSVPLTVFVASIVIIILTVVMVFFSRDSK